MNKKTTGPMEKIHAAFEALPEQESIDEIKAEVKAIGLDPEAALQRFQQAAQQKLKEHRLAWMKKVPAQRAAFEKAKSVASGTLSWVTRAPQEIQAAFDKYIDAQEGAMAFRNKTNLSIEDKAKILDSLNILQASKEEPQ